MLSLTNFLVSKIVINWTAINSWSWKRIRISNRKALSLINAKASKKRFLIATFFRKRCFSQEIVLKFRKRKLKKTNHYRPIVEMFKDIHRKIVQETVNGFKKEVKWWNCLQKRKSKLRQKWKHSSSSKLVNGKTKMRTLSSLIIFPNSLRDQDKIWRPNDFF